MPDSGRLMCEFARQRLAIFPNLRRRREPALNHQGSENGGIPPFLALGTGGAIH
jgi:hypothetical protein